MFFLKYLNSVKKSWINSRHNLSHAFLLTGNEMNWEAGLTNSQTIFFVGEKMVINIEGSPSYILHSFY